MIRLNRNSLIAVAVVASLGLGGAAVAAVNAKSVIETRQNNFKTIGRSMKEINDNLRSSSPNMAAVASNAAVIRGLAPRVESWFPRGTGPEAGVKTEALATIWSDPSGFAAAARRLEPEAAKLEALARAGDVAGARAQVRQVGASCGGCHDKYKAD
ncbi:cytochrome c [Phenylobacterium sp.]|uniref:c-type cytochrome n=1 Tax=Phenylobacterium sp. TaxID=1871053 RepID=UPI0025D649EB|nr:cytochrome c [Phenylobacterium sp.]MCA3721471.1 cytochrome c [Phenylobacterium sp.]